MAEWWENDWGREYEDVHDEKNQATNPNKIYILWMALPLIL